MRQSVNVTVLTNQIAIRLLSSNVIAFGVIYSMTLSCILDNLNTFTDIEESLSTRVCLFLICFGSIFFIFLKVRCFRGFV